VVPWSIERKPAAAMLSRLGHLALVSGAAIALLAAASPAAGAHAVNGYPAAPARSHASHRRAVASRRAVARPAIIGGHPAAAGSFPSLAFIADKRSAREVALCSGTVVAPNLVLTAGHCAENLETGLGDPPSGYRVVTGTVDWNDTTDRQISGVSRVLVFPSFETGGPLLGWGDAALLVLSTPTTAPPIPVASASESGLWQPGSTATIAGWGRTHYRQKGVSETLQWATTVVQSPEWCESYEDFHPHGELCVIDAPADETGGCEGDSGGPLLADSSGALVEIGIVSRGFEECSTDAPTIFTRSELVFPWVHRLIEALSPGTAQAPVPGVPVSEPPPLSLAQADATIRSIIRRWTGRAPHDLNDRCASETASAVACDGIWATGPASSSAMLYWGVFRLERQDDGLHGSFVGHQVQGGCAQRFGVKRCTSRVHWRQG